MPEPVIIHDPRSVMLLPSNDPRRIAFEAAVAEQLSADREAHAVRLAAAEPVHSSADCRTALRVAIQKHADLMQRLNELAKAVPASDAAVIAARQAVEKATAMLEAAKAGAAAHAAAKVLGEPGTVAPSLKAARVVLSDAEDQLEIAQAAA